MERLTIIPVKANSGSVKILVNATTITVGGGLQAAVSFIEYVAALGSCGPTLLFAVSMPVHNGLPKPLRSDSRIQRFDRSPADPLRRWRVCRELLELEQKFCADLVYSIGFPSYVVFRAAEAGRYTNGWEICDFPAAWSVLPARERLGRIMRSRYRLRWARHARYFETQTEVAKSGIVQKLGIDPCRVFVSPNAVNPRFIDVGKGATDVSPHLPPHRIFCLSAAHRHKNLSMIPRVAAILEREFGVDCLFVLTLPAGSDLWDAIANEAERLGVRHRVENVGPLDLDGCVGQYREARCVFLPTLAEIFSATYLEAMAMRVPIVTSDLDFARWVCEEAAVYYDPLSSKAAARAIRSVVTDAALSRALVAKGEQRLRDFPDPATKHRRLLDWLVDIATSEAAVESRQRS